MSKSAPVLSEATKNAIARVASRTAPASVAAPVKPETDLFAGIEPAKVHRVRESKFAVLLPHIRTARAKGFGYGQITEVLSKNFPDLKLTKASLVQYVRNAAPELVRERKAKGETPAATEMPAAEPAGIFKKKTSAPKAKKAGK